MPSNDLDLSGNNATFYISPGDDTIGSPYNRTEVGEHMNSGSHYGTFDQCVNEFEWSETVYANSLSVWGGDWTSRYDDLSASDHRTRAHRTRTQGFAWQEFPNPAPSPCCYAGWRAWRCWEGGGRRENRRPKTGRNYSRKHLFPRFVGVTSGSAKVRLSLKTQGFTGFL